MRWLEGGGHFHRNRRSPCDERQNKQSVAHRSAHFVRGLMRIRQTIRGHVLGDLRAFAWREFLPNLSIEFQTSMRNLDIVARVGLAVSNTTRLHVFQLADGHLSLGEIATVINVSPSTVTHHVHVLADAGLVELIWRGRQHIARRTPFGLHVLTNAFVSSALSTLRPSRLSEPTDKENGRSDHSKRPHVDPIHRR